MPQGPDISLIDGPYAFYRLGLSVLLGTIGSVGMWAVIVVMPAVEVEFAVSRADASLPYTATMLGFALGNFLIGRFVDRFGITLPIAVAALMLGSGFILASFSTGILMFSVIQGVLIGIGTSASFGPLISDISHWFKKRRGMAVGAVASGNYLAGTIWPPIIEGIADAEGWRTAYLIAGIGVVSVILPLSLLLRRRNGTDDAIIPSDQPVPQNDTVAIDLSPRNLQVLLVVAGIACCVAMSMPQVHIVAYCVELGFGVARGAEMLSVMLAGGVVSRLASGFLADRFGAIRVVILGSALQCTALFLYLPFDGLVSLYVVSLVFGLSQGGIVPGYAMIVRDYLPAREAGEKVGLVMMATVIGMALGGWLSGWIFDLTLSYEAAFFNGIAWNMVNILILLFIFYRSKQRQLSPA